MVGENGENKIVLCRKPYGFESEDLDVIRATGTTSAYIHDFIGNEFIVINYELDWSRRYDILNAIFPKWSVCLWNKAQSFFDKDDEGDVFFFSGRINDCNVEKHLARKIKAAAYKVRANPKDRLTPLLTYRVAEILRDPWIWNYHSGSEIDEILTAAKDLGCSKSDPSENFLLWPIFSRNMERLNSHFFNPPLKGSFYDAAPCKASSSSVVIAPIDAHHPSAASVVVEKPAEDIPSECTVCMEKPANTVVLPCKHKVVCYECSTKIAGTANSRICIYCRQPITSILSTFD